MGKLPGRPAPGRLLPPGSPAPGRLLPPGRPAPGRLLAANGLTDWREAEG